MKRRTFIVFASYVWLKTLLKLTFRPFTAIREMARRPVLLPVILSPFLGLLTLFVLGRIAALLITLYGIHREFMAILLSTAFISICLWQILLLYLFGSIFIAFLRNKR